MRAVMAEPFRQPGMSVQKEGLEELVIYRLILLPGNNLPVCISRLWGVNDTFFGVIDMLIDNSIMKDLTGKTLFSEQNASGARKDNPLPDRHRLRCSRRLGHLCGLQNRFRPRAR